MRAGQRLLVPMGARRAQRVLTLSEASAKEVARVTGVDRSKIEVVHIAARPAGPAAPEAEMRARLGLGENAYILAPSARRGHKNLGRLLDAASLLEHRIDIVLPGYATGAEDALAEQIERLGLSERVHLLGWIEDADLDALYAYAQAVVFPSLAEGFGLPVLEAMEHGTPVATSNISSMPEVGGDAAVYFDPYEVHDIARVVDELLGDSALRERLSIAGVRRAGEFSWKKAAEQTTAVYDELLASTSS
jgi:alpha-1,3-rhamnosyl/mannosyltransferase